MTLTCRFCAAPLEATFADLGMSPLANSYVPPEQRATRWSRSIRCTRYVCAQCFLVQLGEFESPEQIFGDYAYFSSYSSSWLEHSQALRRRDDRALRARRRRAAWSRSPPTTATCCSTSSSAASRCSASSRRPTSPRSRRESAACRRWCASSASRPRARSRAERQRRPAAGQQRARPRAGPQRLRRRHEGAAQARRRDHDGVPAPAAADRRQPVGHDLPRALLVLLVHDRARASSPPTACGCSTSRSCRRTAARCGSSAATPTTRPSPRPSARPSCWRARTPPATRRSTTYLDYGAAGGRGQARRSSRR